MNQKQLIDKRFLKLRYEIPFTFWWKYIFTYYKKSFILIFILVRTCYILIVLHIQNNNLFVKNLVTNKTVAVTNDGKNNEIINGNCDWVYEEEFSFTQAFDWSANGNFVAFYRFDESKVKEFSFDEFNGLYPTQNKFKYPKVTIQQ